MPASVPIAEGCRGVELSGGSWGGCPERQGVCYTLALFEAAAEVVPPEEVTYRF